ncbi:MAG: leucine-rich repeat protein, partial [Ruminococcus sp.]|nr:leucine-rich repeat protein [Ruminococcus sp.]
PNAFKGCTSLEKIEIPNPETSIGRSAFSNCPELTIYAPKGSKAETFARANNIKYKEN